QVGIGVVEDEGVISLAAAGCAFPDIPAIIAGGAAALEQIRDLTDVIAPHHRLGDVRLLAPLRPGKYLAIGMNYAKHVAEMGRDSAPSHQYWFNKQTTCINGPFDDIDPGVSEKVDYEVELGVVIGARAKGVSADAALSHVFGYL